MCQYRRGLAAGGERLLQTDFGEAQGLAGQGVAQARQVGADHGGDFRIAADGLAIGEQDDGPTVAGYLDGARRHGIGNDVGAACVLEARAVEAQAHAVGLAADAEFGV